MTSTLINTLSGVIATTLGVGLLAGATVLVAGKAEGGLALLLFGVVIAALSFGVFAIGFLLSQVISRFMTAAVSASVDTREKLTEITAFTSPKEKFLKKFQRMEESLFELQTRLYAAELAKLDLDIIKCKTTECLNLKTEERYELVAARIEAGIPDPYKAKWYDALQHYCLRNWYWCNSEKLKVAISKTEDWLNRAAKQKELLTDEHREQEELYNQGAPSIAGSSEVALDNWVLV